MAWTVARIASARQSPTAGQTGAAGRGDERRWRVDTRATLQRRSDPTNGRPIMPVVEPCRWHVRSRGCRHAELARSTLYHLSALHRNTRSMGRRRPAASLGRACGVGHRYQDAPRSSRTRLRIGGRSARPYGSRPSAPNNPGSHRSRRLPPATSVRSPCSAASGASARRMRLEFVERQPFAARQGSPRRIEQWPDPRLVGIRDRCVQAVHESDHGCLHALVERGEPTCRHLLLQPAQLLRCQCYRHGASIADRAPQGTQAEASEMKRLAGLRSGSSQSCPTHDPVALAPAVA